METQANYDTGDNAPAQIRDARTEQRTHRKTLELLYELLSDSTFSEMGLRITGLSIISHALARMDGRTVETQEGLQWGIEKLQELGIVPADTVNAD